MKKGTKCILAIIGVTVFVGIVVLNAQAQPHDEVWVDDDAAPGWYNSDHVRTIQEGIDNASVGGTVYVWNGNYSESVIVNKTVTIIGNTTVDALNGVYERKTNLTYFEYGFWIEADYVNISGFYLEELPSIDFSGVHLNESDYCNISGNVIMYDSSDGICLENSSNNTIFNNILGYNYIGIYLISSDNNTLTNNNASSNDGYGIYLSNSDNNTLTGNTANNNNNYGFYLNPSSHTILTDNTANDNYYCGLYAYYSDYLRILGGNYSHNGYYGCWAANIYVYRSNNILIDDVIVDEPIQVDCGSCPFLYTWNGAEFEFINEMELGSLSKYAYEGGPLLKETWEDHPFYRTPTAPQDVDYLRKIEGNQLQPLNGKYEIRFTEELDEINYADLMELWTVDHAPGVDVYTDWTYRNNIYTVADPVPPLWAVDHNGEDVLSLISAKDWDEWMSDWREFVYEGMTVEEGIENNFGGYITLKLGNWSETPDNLKLVITENRERGINEKIKVQFDEMRRYYNMPPPKREKLWEIVSGPRLQIKDAEGKWVDAPSEYQRIEAPLAFNVTRSLDASTVPTTYVIDLSGLYIPDYEIRYRVPIPFNRHHIDQILVDTSPPQEVMTTILQPSHADLHYRGSSRQGLIMFSSRANEWNTGYDYYDGFFYINYNDIIGTCSPQSQSGYYTRYGDVLPLLQSINDEFVIMGKGDELSLQFDFMLPEIGLERDFVFRDFGYYKPNALALSDTVDPLPFEAMTMYPYDESIENYDYDNHTDYLANYQTRFYEGHHSAYGIYMYYSINFTINNARGVPENVFDDEYGIEIYGCEKGTITYCSFTDGWDYGFFICYSNDCTISHNEIRDNEHGIYLYDSSNNTITWNMIENNTEIDTGLHITVGSNDNEIHRNCFINNIPQAWDDGLRNSWNSNFWSDYPVRGGRYNIQGSANSRDPHTLEQCPGPVAQVPALTPLGILLLIGLIAIIAVITIKRKHR